MILYRFVPLPPTIFFYKSTPKTKFARGYDVFLRPVFFARSDVMKWFFGFWIGIKVARHHSWIGFTKCLQHFSAKLPFCGVDISNDRNSNI